MVLWIDKISLTTLIYLLFYPPFYCCKKIKYFRGNKIPLFLIRIIKLQSKHFRIDKIHSGNSDRAVETFVKDEEGRFLFRSIEEDVSRIIDTIRNDVFVNIPFLTNAVANIPHIWIKRYFCQVIHNKVYNYVLYFTVFHYLRQRNDVENNRGERLLVQNDCFRRYYTLCKYYNENDVIIYIKNIVQIKLYAYLLISIFFLLLSCMSCVLVGCINNYRKVWKMSNEKEKKALIGVQYCWGHDIGKRNDLYWFKDVGISAERVLLYFNRADRPLTKEIEAHLVKQGFGIACPKAIGIQKFILRFIRNPLSFFLPNKKEVNLRSYSWHPGIGFSFSLVRSLVLLFMRSISSIKLNQLNQTVWILVHSLKLFYKVNYWKHFYLENNVKVHMSHSSDRGSNHNIQTMAMHLCNGINIKSNYSYSHICNISDFSREFHVYFSWGEETGCYTGIDKIYSCYNVVTGYLFDYLFCLNQDASHGSKFNESVDFVITLFDEAHDVGIVQSFYNSFFDLVLKNKNIGLVIKSKKLSFNDLGELCSKFEESYKAGNVIVVDKTESPYKAILNSDIAVCLGINSAGIEAALFGKRALYWIFDVHVCSQLERDVGSKLVFRDSNDLFNTLEQAARDKAKLHNLGDHSRVIDKIDPWRDGNAGRRIGEYMKNYLDALDDSQDRNIALKIANERYSKKWGYDKIIENKECIAEKI